MKELLISVYLTPFVRVTEWTPDSPLFANVKYNEDNLHNGGGSIDRIWDRKGNIPEFGNWYMRTGTFWWHWNESGSELIMTYTKTPYCLESIIHRMGNRGGSNAGKISAEIMAMSLTQACIEHAIFIKERYPTPKEYYQAMASFYEKNYPTP